jgi:hypothetical protein
VDYPPAGIIGLVSTTDRDLAASDGRYALVGFDNVVMTDIVKRLHQRSPADRAVAVRSPDEPFLLVTLVLSLFGERNTVTRKLTKLAISKDGRRLPEKEHLDHLDALSPVDLNEFDAGIWQPVVDFVPELLERDMKYRGLLSSGASYEVEFVGMLIGTI